MSEHDTPTEPDLFGPDIFHLTANGTVAVPKEFREKMRGRKLQVEETEEGTLQFTALEFEH